MASYIQILICVVLVKGQFYPTRGLQHQPRLDPDLAKRNEPLDKNVDSNYGHEPPQSHPISDEMPPETITNRKVNMPLDKEYNNDNQLGLDKKKDYLLVGSGNNGNNVYLLHENNPNPNLGYVPNANQPGNNINYVPYNPGQSTNQVYYVANGQTGILPTNQVSQDKQNLNGYNNATPNLRYPTVNSNSASQNPGYVLVYSNGQLVQMPGVVVNSVQNNVPLQNRNPVQGVNNAGNIMSNNGLPSNFASNQPNQNMIMQPVVPISNGVPNGYVLANTVPNQVQGPNNAVNMPTQNATPNNQNVPFQSTVGMPVNSGSNGYNQPMVSNQGTNTVVNNPNHGTVIDQTATLRTPVRNNEETIVLDNNHLSDFNAQPAIMISGYKETATDKTEKQKTKEKNDKSKKTEKRYIDTEEI